MIVPLLITVDRDLILVNSIINLIENFFDPIESPTKPYSSEVIGTKEGNVS